MAQSPAHIRATTRFEHKTYDKITVRLRKDGDLTRDQVQAAADRTGESLNAFIIDAIKRKIES
jgi:uncharacterized protein (DUF1778 family)